MDALRYYPTVASSVYHILGVNIPGGAGKVGNMATELWQVEGAFSRWMAAAEDDLNEEQAYREFQKVSSEYARKFAPESSVEPQNIPTGYTYKGRGETFTPFPKPVRCAWTRAKGPDWEWTIGYSVCDVPCMHYAVYDDAAVEKHSAREWFSLLPGPAKKLAISNTSPSNLDTEFRTLSDALMSAFYWGDTEQGDTYWNNIYASYVKVTFAEMQVLASQGHPEAKG